MNQDLSHLILDDKKFNESNLEKYLASQNAIENIAEVVEIFSKINSAKEKYSPQTFYLFWKYFNTVGKIKLANECVDIHFSKLLESKKIIKIKAFIEELREGKLAIHKAKIKKYETQLLVLTGDKKAYQQLDKNELPVDWHGDYWGEGSDVLKDKILNNTQWNLEKVKLIYEFVLKNNFEEEVFLSMKDQVLLNNKYKKDFIDLLNKYHVSLVEKNNNNLVEKESLKVNYDNLAFEIFSGQKDPGEFEQRKIISTLKFIEEEQLKSKGSEMLVAFKMLDMDEVVQSLANILLGLISDEKMRASITFVLVQSLIDSKKYFDAKESIDLILRSATLNIEEQLEFVKLKKEIYEREGKLDHAKSIDLEIKNINKTLRQLALGRS